MLINIYIKGLGLIPDSDIPPRQQNISWLFRWKTANFAWSVPSFANKKFDTEEEQF